MLRLPPPGLGYVEPVLPKITTSRRAKCGRSQLLLCLPCFASLQLRGGICRMGRDGRQKPGDQTGGRWQLSNFVPHQLVVSV